MKLVSIQQELSMWSRYLLNVEYLFLYSMLKCSFYHFRYLWKCKSTHLDTLHFSPHRCMVSWLELDLICMVSWLELDLI